MTQPAVTERLNPAPVRWVSRRRVILLIAAIATLAVDAAYVLVIRDQGGFAAGDRPRVLLFATFVAVAGVLAFAASLLPVDVRLPLLAAAATVLLATGFLGLPSIGVPLFVAGVLVTGVTTYDAREAHEGAMFLAAFAIVGALAALGVGIAMT